MSTFRRFERLEAIADEIARAPALKGRLLVVEDLHNADDETFEVFLRLVTRAPTSQFYIVATFRTEGLLAARLAGLLESQFTTHSVRNVHLSRLTLHQTEELVRSFLGPHRDVGSVSRVAQKLSGGNPLFLVEWLRGLIETEAIQGGPFRWQIDLTAAANSAPGVSLQDQVRRRLAQIEGVEFDVLAWLSAFGIPCSAAFLHEASGLPFVEVRYLLESLVGKGLLSRESTAGGELFRFFHDLLRQCVYESLPAHQRAALHRSVGVSLERREGGSNPESAAALAFHFLHAADPVKGPKYALAAATLAEQRGATHQAISWYHSSLNLITTDRMDLRYEVLEKLASLLRMAGDPARAETSYLEILLAARRRGDSLREALALTHLGKIHSDRGNLEEARAYAERALPVYRSLDSPAREAETLLVLSLTAYKSGNYMLALDLASQAMPLARATASCALLGHASNLAGMAETSLRRYDDALREFEAWLSACEGSLDVFGETMALVNIGWVYLERGLLDIAEGFFQRSRTSITEKGMLHLAITASINSGEVARLRGAYTDSRTRFQDGLLASQRAERTDTVQYVFYSLGLVELETGALGESRANLDRALALSEKMGAKGSHALTKCAMGDFELCLGRWNEASATFREAANGGMQVGDNVIWSTGVAGVAESLILSRVSCLSPKVGPGGRNGISRVDPTTRRPDVLIEGNSACSPPGDSAEAVQPNHSSAAPVTACGDDPISLADRAYELASGVGSRQTMIRADLAGALVYLAEGQIETSLARSERAAKLAEECGMRPDRARALLYRGMALRAAEKVVEAECAIIEARTIADEIGLALVRARSRAELMALYERRGDGSLANQLAAEAAELLNAMARTLPEAEDRQCFLAVPWREAVLQRHETAQRAAQHSAADSAILDSTLSSSIDETGGRSISQEEARRSLPADPAREAALSPKLQESASAARPSRATPPPTDDSSAPRDLRSTLAMLLEESHRSVGSDRGMVFLIAPDGTSEIVVARGLESESIEDARSYCRSVIDRAAQGEEILVIDTARDERFRDRHSVGLFHIVSIICLPLRVGTKVMGALYLDSRAGGRLLREDDLRAARAMAARMNGSIRAAWDQERRREEALLRQKVLCQTYRLDAIIGDSHAMRKAYRVLEAVIASDCNVLVTGESGTGKELAARAIHFSGRRKMSPFVAVDCGALPDALVESELFGYRKGAFTGADADKRGLFEEADGGTLFLDEITNTSTLFQSKLLRVLQAGELRRVGDTTPRKVDVRIIAATNADLEETIRAGRFREDLFYRLNVVTVTMPPLRERAEDIPALAEQFAHAFCEKEKIAYRGVGDSALKALSSHPWPGNVRELKNAIEAALILSRDGAVRRDFLPESIRGGSFEEIRGLLHEGAPGEDGSGSPTTDTPSPAAEPGREAADARGASASPEGWLTEDELNKVRQLEERVRILDALGRAEGDKSLAASILGCSRMTLYRRMRKLGIEYSAGRETPVERT